MGNAKVCNACGRELLEKNGVLQEGALIIKKDWGYFSKKDLQVHEFNICEDCYDKWIETLVVPVKILEKTEVLGEWEREKADSHKETTFK